MKLYVIQKRNNYYSCVMPRGSVIYTEHFKNAHVFAESERGEAEGLARQYHGRLVELECTPRVVLDAEEAE